MTKKLKLQDLSWVPYRDSFEMQIRASKEKAKANSTTEQALGEYLSLLTSFERRLQPDKNLR